MHYDLPIYRAVYKFVLKLFDIIRGFPREYKYTIGQDMRHDAIELQRFIICANKYKAQRMNYLEALQESVELMKLQVRLCFDMHVINVKQHSALSDMLENISKQTAGWKYASSAKNKL